MFDFLHDLFFGDLDHDSTPRQSAAGNVPGRLAQSRHTIRRAWRAINDELHQLEHLLEAYPFAHDRQQQVHRPQPAALDATPSDDGLQHFHVSGQFLHQSFRYLREESVPAGHAFSESYHHVAGFQFIRNHFILLHLVRVAFSRQTATGVTIDPASNVAAFTELTATGLAFVAHCHTHPGHGPHANLPSTVDLAYQHRLERIKNIAVGGIFSQDGYLRFFAGDPARFRCHIHGNQVKEINPDEHLFQLELAHGPIPVAPAHTTVTRRGPDR